MKILGGLSHMGVRGGGHVGADVKTKKRGLTGTGTSRARFL